MNGEVDPIRGAWTMFGFSANEDESPDFHFQVRTFIDLADACVDAGPHVARHRAEIVAEARRFLERGGLRLRRTTG